MATIWHKKTRCNFWTAYGKCTCKSKIILSTLYPLDTFRYDTVSLSMTISHLQIAVFLNSHPAVGLRPTAVVMAGLRPAMTTGGLENSNKYLHSLIKTVYSHNQSSFLMKNTNNININFNNRLTQVLIL